MLPIVAVDGLNVPEPPPLSVTPAVAAKVPPDGLPVKVTADAFEQ